MKSRCRVIQPESYCRRSNRRVRLFWLYRSLTRRLLQLSPRRDAVSNDWRGRLQAGLSDRYQIRDELGGGGMSSTFVAEEVALGRSVVLKALPPQFAAGVNAERFEREIHVAARLQHAFIVPLHAAGMVDGTPWYTMPLVQGESLRTRLAREGALAPNAAARILRDVAEALAYAHAQGVVHRDIKPDNVLLSGSHALVTDFGVAKALAASTSGHAGMTGVGIALGTPAYMAPEQAAGDSSTDHRADLYALGAMAYEMISGRPMFGERSAVQLLTAHATEKPESLARLAPAAPSELIGLIEQLLAKHPNDRPAQAQHVAEALGAMITRWTSGELPPVRGHVSLGTALGLWLASFLGVVGAAWLAVRWLPVPEWTFPGAILVMLAGLPVMALSAWLHRPARPLTPAPSVASTTTVGRLEAIVRPHLDWGRAKRGGVIAVGALALLVVLWGASRALGIGPAATLRSQGVLTEADRVLVADFDGPPNDTSLGTVVSDLLRTELARSASLRLVDAADRSNALIGMGRGGAERITNAIAGEVAQRVNAKVHIAGGVTPLGTGYVLRAALIESASGRELAALRGTSTSADGLIAAVDKLGREVRDKLGASLREVRASDPLLWAVTPSLAALRQFTEGVRQANLGNNSIAVRHLERAIASDSAFAMAYARMVSYYANIGNQERANWASVRAFQYREKLPRIQQLEVEASYYARSPHFDWARYISTYETLLDLDPQHSIALNNLALAYLAQREPERALELFQRRIKVDSTSAFGPHNIVMAYLAMGRKEDARRYIEERLVRWQPTAPRTKRTRAMLAYADLMIDSAAALFQAALERERAAEGGFRLSLFYAMQGRLKDAMLGYARLPQEADTALGVPRSVFFRSAYLAWLLERPEEARALLDSITAAHPPATDASPHGYAWLTVVTHYAMAGDARRARVFLREFESRATPNDKAWAPDELEIARGWLAVAERRYDDAVRAFRAADVRRCTVCALAPLAYAYDLAGQPDSAIAAFERYLSTPTATRYDTADDVFLAGTYKRLGELYDARGDVEKARTYYAKFIDLWKNADPELQPKVRDARRRLAVLASKQG